MNPSSVVRVSEWEFLTRLTSNLARHDAVVAGFGVFSVPHRNVLSVPRPCGIEFGVSAVGELVETRAVNIDDADGCDPLADIGVAFQSAEEHEHVTGL